MYTIPNNITIVKLNTNNTDDQYNMCGKKKKCVINFGHTTRRTETSGVTVVDRMIILKYILKKHLMRFWTRWTR